MVSKKYTLFELTALLPCPSSERLGYSNGYLRTQARQTSGNELWVNSERPVTFSVKCCRYFGPIDGKVACEMWFSQPMETREGISPSCCLKSQIFVFRESTVVLFSRGVRQAGGVGSVPPIHPSPVGVREGWRNAGFPDFAQEASSGSCTAWYNSLKGNPGDPNCLSHWRELFVYRTSITQGTQTVIGQRRAVNITGPPIRPDDQGICSKVDISSRYWHTWCLLCYWHTWYHVHLERKKKRGL